VGPGEAQGSAAAGCTACRRQRLPWERTVRLGEYDGLLRDLVHEVKFTAWRQLGVTVGRLLGRSLAAALREDGVNPDRTILVPMPTTYTRRMSRGIDHARVIARGVREVTGLPIVTALERSRRPSQRSVPVSGRVANVAGSIRVIPGVSLAGWTAIVIDDVKTTGATMAAACRALSRGGREARLTSRSDFVRNSDGVRLWAGLLAVTEGTGPRPRITQEVKAEEQSDA
jgi:predicted amidophosphoribosyltransferase